MLHVRFTGSRCAFRHVILAHRLRCIYNHAMNMKDDNLHIFPDMCWSDVQYRHVELRTMSATPKANPQPSMY